jgi:aryl-alcohol dehydrogenase-like predicted oxidoreductase
MIETVQLAEGYTVPRIIVGGWQLSAGHASHVVERDRLFEALASWLDAGFTTFDCADIYGGVEQLLGDFCAWYRERRGTEAADRMQVHTKFVPDRDDLTRISRQYVERIIDRSLRRLRVERLDLVQFHWWNVGVPGYVETAAWLGQLQRDGKIRLLGATNFDSARLAELLSAGTPIASHQVQYSVLDRRPGSRMVDLCARHGIRLLCYGTVAGGFLADRYLGAPAPADPLPNRSLVKYRLIIEEFGGWPAFQELMRVLAVVAHRHRAGISTVATRWILDRDQVGGAIVGAHDASHRDETQKTFALELDAEDRERIAAVLERHDGPTGDVYQLEREMDGKHAAIMRYNLNREG